PGDSNRAVRPMWSMVVPGRPSSDKKRKSPSSTWNSNFSGAGSVPVLADPLTAARRPPLLLRGNAMARAGLLDRLTPTGVLRLGGSPTSKAIATWLAVHPEVPQVLVDEVGRRDPAGSATTHLRADPEAVAWALEGYEAEPGWLDAWRAAEAAIDQVFADLPWPSEPAIAATVTACLGARDLWVGSSMPIRDVDDFGVGVDGRIHGTRGANGIDGLLSAAAGASALTGRQGVVLLGDIAFLHDLGGVLTARRLGADLTIVVVDNRGGGIFSFLPQADQPGPFDLLATPHGFDVAEIAKGLGARVVDVPTREALERFLAPGPGLHVAVVSTDRAENKALHDDLLAAARSAIG
ncbi:MAG: thiamine pyrophosphate-dependent enzyme, partial [Acidimicrobiia bacterium]